MSKLVFVEETIQTTYIVKFCDELCIKTLSQTAFKVRKKDIEWATNLGFITTEDVMCGQQTEYDVTAWLMVKKARIHKNDKAEKYIIFRGNDRIEDFACRLKESGID